MNKNVFHKLIGVEESYEAPAALMEILYDKEKREILFKEMLELHDFNLRYDWFHGYFQDEHADRKIKKQDYTPKAVAQLLNALADTHGAYYEIAAGTGGILIQHWDQIKYKYNLVNCKPSRHLSIVEEIDNRNIPFLLFNCMIRGMNAVVIHCDSLSRNCKGVFLVQNFLDHYLNFSDLNVFPYNETVEKEFSVRFNQGRYYKSHIERVKFYY